MKKVIYIIMCLCTMMVQSAHAEVCYYGITSNAVARENGAQYIVKNVRTGNFLLLGSDGKLTITSTAPTPISAGKYSSASSSYFITIDTDGNISGLQSSYTAYNPGSTEVEISNGEGEVLLAKTMSIETEEAADVKSTITVGTARLMEYRNALMSTTDASITGAAEWYFFKVSAIPHAYTTDSDGFMHCSCGHEALQEANLVNGVYEIGNLGQLYWFAQNSADKSGALIADIVVNKGTFDSYGNFYATGSTVASTPRSWTPITLSKWKTFNGNGHTVSGLYYSGKAALVGLFACSKGAIFNLGVKDSYFCSTSNAQCEEPEAHVGGVCGELQGGLINNCYVTNVTCIANPYGGGGSVSGGVCGYVKDSSIKYCYAANVTVPASDFDPDSEFRGPIVGIYRSSTIDNCYCDMDDTSINWAGTPADIAKMPAKAFTNGEVCWLLNKKSVSGNDVSFYQDLSATNSYPTLKQNANHKVYYFLDEYTNTGSKTLTLSKVGNYYYTVVAPDQLACIQRDGDKIRVYSSELDEENHVVRLTYDSKSTNDFLIKKDTPVILRSESATVDICQYTGSVPSSYSYPTSCLTPVKLVPGAERTLSSNERAFSVRQGMIGFFPYDGVVPAFKGFLTLPNTSNARQGYLCVFDEEGDDEVTGIGEVRGERLEVRDAGAVYNINGQRLAAPMKGINIVNGKKILK